MPRKPHLTTRTSGKPRPDGGIKRVREIERGGEALAPQQLMVVLRY